MTKIIYSTLLLMLASYAQAQIVIGGKQDIEGTTTLLDFNNTATNTLGIILPAVTNVTNALAAIPVNSNGTFLFDRSVSKVKMYQNNVWVDLSDTGSSTKIMVNNSNDYTTTQGVIIGSPTSNAKGVMVLESANKAMILPRIANPHTSVKSPYPGMMCYDTYSNSLAIFDGTNWNYWK